ncbi:hypothetical protein L226DRAFT_201550 [Lentinus tigrinus ALCF2SS1-7]|uniref:Uncharacterized protein n=1 Tax=Lentinus tigrinus ALCF2SS1-6 TaxID=1328759 RepID=A0A5C2ST26_9APHY|nr:hypothetical protein L227DRAFT_147598 [Lentinus tigrinus ALCF2SS1-6]RPD80458.1 hypothetical protein L226DRAFT_201550 [Lentinus tigrinus ALCF2SS1-7]
MHTRTPPLRPRTADCTVLPGSSDQNYTPTRFRGRTHSPVPSRFPFTHPLLFSNLDAGCTPNTPFTITRFSCKDGIPLANNGPLRHNLSSHLLLHSHPPGAFFAHTKAQIRPARLPSPMFVHDRLRISSTLRRPGPLHSIFAFVPSALMPTVHRTPALLLRLSPSRKGSQCRPSSKPNAAFPCSVPRLRALFAPRHAHVSLPPSFPMCVIAPSYPSMQSSRRVHAV